jgi:hypothetical protein
MFVEFKWSVQNCRVSSDTEVKKWDCENTATGISWTFRMQLPAGAGFLSLPPYTDWFCCSLKSPVQLVLGISPWG